jgi:hypothetical protein
MAIESYHGASVESEPETRNQKPATSVPKCYALIRSAQHYVVGMMLYNRFRNSI